MTDKQEELPAEAEAKSEIEATSQNDPRDAIISRLEQALAGKDSEVSVLKQQLGESERRLDSFGKALAQAVVSYKGLVIQTNPGVLPELINGNTVDEVNESLKNARAIIDRVRQELEAEASRTRVPAGAPQRSPIDLSALSPREKIQYAIGGKK